jgi:outer membrane protein assembly factor BamB
MRTILLCGLLLACTVTAGAEPKLQWKLELPARKQAWVHTQRMRRDVAYPLFAQGGQLLIACEHNGALLAVDLATGEERWRFYTGAPIRQPPVGDTKRVFVTSDDGYLYALDREGKLLWRFRGGPGERKAIGHERLISAWPGAAVAVADRDKVIFVAGHWPVDGVYIHALGANRGEVLWTNTSAQYRPSDLIRVQGGNLFVYGHGGGGAYDLRTGRAVDVKRPPLTLPEPLTVPERVEGDVVDARMHDGRLVAVTAQGRIYCFADRDPGRAAADEPLESLSTAETEAESGDPEINEAAQRLLEQAGVREGYALILGLDDGSLVEGLLRGSDLHVVAADRDKNKVDTVRRRLDARSLFDDHRLAVYQGDPATLGLPPYMASLITTETSQKLTDALLESLRPYGGTFAVASGNQVTIQRRNGPAAGAGQWTHEYADAGNSLSSGETVARAPLGVLWYEGPAGAARFYFDGLVDHQSGHGVSPLPPGALIVGGRMILQGPGRLGAFDIYTGRLLWETELPEVYGYGGREGGVGIHSRKHREPWRYEPAMKAEIPATHHSRTTGLNYAAAGDGIYICAGRELLCVSLEDGSRVGSWNVPLPEAEKDTLCWGSVRVVGDRLVATAFRPRDLVDAQCGHDGNGGDWSKDRMPMAHLMVLDRKTGKLSWNRRAAIGFLNRGIAVTKDTVFCIDTIAPHTLEKFRAAKRAPRSTPMLYALDLVNGKTRWQFEPGVAVLNLTYSQPRDVLVVPCRNLITWQDGQWVVEGGGSKPHKNAPGQMWGLRGKDGKVLWSVNEAAYSEPHIVLGDMILDRYCHSYDLLSGQRNLRTNPLTGEEEPWHFRKGGCNHLVACPTLVTWRTAFYDLANHSGSMPLLGMNMGCTATMLPAGGVLNVPNFGTHHKRSRMTALALIHRPGNRLWTQYHTSREKRVSPSVAIRRAGFNFGAPGDRFAEGGTLWLSITSRKSENVEVTPKECDWYRMEPEQTELWITGYGAQGLGEIVIPMIVTSDKNARRADDETRRYDVRLHFAEPEPLKPGQRVFTVSLEGKPVLENLDVVKAAGGPYKTLTREWKNVEVQGPLNLNFTASRGKPLVCGVEVIAR